MPVGMASEGGKPLDRGCFPKTLPSLKSLGFTCDTSLWTHSWTEGQEGERTAPQGPLTLGGLEGPVETSAYPWEDRCLEVEKRGHALGLEEGLHQEG